VGHFDSINIPTISYKLMIGSICQFFQKCRIKSRSINSPISSTVKSSNFIRLHNRAKHSSLIMSPPHQCKQFRFKFWGVWGMLLVNLLKSVDPFLHVPYCKLYPFLHRWCRTGYYWFYEVFAHGAPIASLYG